MSENIFCPGDILLPWGMPLSKWSVVACDQYTSQPEYWEHVEAMVGETPSALRLILPEAWLGSRDTAAVTAQANDAMRDYLARDMFRVLEQSYILVERQLRDGRRRLGLMGLIDLENYDYSPRATAPIRATEGTVEDRLPPRAAVRRNAVLEMPHVMLLMDDPDDIVLGPLYEDRLVFPRAYDFRLMCDSGHLAGWQLTENDLIRVEASIAALADPEERRARYGADGDKAPVFAVGDGNHSLAAAKLCWEETKAGLSPEEQMGHPARYSLVELVNIHDESLDFAPIHRLVTGIDGADFLNWAQARLAAAEGERCYPVTLAAGDETREIAVKAPAIGALIAAAEDLVQDYAREKGGHIDYIHGDREALALAARPGCAALLLPALDKAELFPSILKSGVFPRKSFSIGQAEDKRFYLEARKIVRD